METKLTMEERAFKAVLRDARNGGIQDAADRLAMSWRQLAPILEIVPEYVDVLRPALAMFRDGELYLARLAIKEAGSKREGMMAGEIGNTLRMAAAMLSDRVAEINQAGMRLVFEPQYSDDGKDVVGCSFSLAPKVANLPATGRGRKGTGDRGTTETGRKLPAHDGDTAAQIVARACVANGGQLARTAIEDALEAGGKGRNVNRNAIAAQSHGILSYDGDDRTMRVTPLGEQWVTEHPINGAS